MKLAVKKDNLAGQYDDISNFFKFTTTLKSLHIGA